MIMKFIKIFILFSIFSMTIPKFSYAFHGDNIERFLSIMKSYSRYDITRVTKSKVGMQIYGDSTQFASDPNLGEPYDEFFDDKFNLAAIVLKNGEVVYERYNQ